MNVFNTSREIPATPADVFAAMENPAHMASWWGPAGFRNTFTVFEFKVGGAWQFTMHGPDGKDYWNECEFVAIERDHKLVIQHVNAPRFLLTITLSATPAGTLVAWSQAFEDAAVAQAVRHIVEPANEENLDRLAALVHTGGSSIN
jgi:uncharacterized protein YndB with AHSA1/START domain